MEDEITVKHWFWDNGEILRTVAEHGIVLVESWRGGRWVRLGRSIASLLTAGNVSPERLRKAGIPESDWPTDLILDPQYPTMRYTEDIAPADEYDHRFITYVRLGHRIGNGAGKSWAAIKSGPVGKAAGMLIREITDYGSDVPLSEGPVLCADVPARYRVVEARAPLAPLSELLERGKAIAVPLIGVHNEPMLDGGLYWFEWYDGFCKPSYIEWANHGPPEWKELIAWTNELRDFFRGCFPMKYQDYW